MRKQPSNPVFAQLARKETRRRMVMVALGILHGRAETEDAAHDAVEQALRGSASFRAEAQVGTWLHRVVVNAALMHMRRSRRENLRLANAGHANDNDQRDRLLSVSDPTPLAASQLEANEQHERLRQAVAELPAPYREVVVLGVFKELSLPEVAHTLGITPQAVRTRMCRARARLKAQLAA
jgi:RNA polymerase sigma-70 factor (ECF subfamily)